MPLLAKILKLMLIACTLGYTNAWAFENVMQHDSDATGVSTLSEASLVQVLPDNEDVACHVCDHCCHASAHLLALESKCPGQHIVLSDSIISVLEVSAVSHISLPDSPPPKFLF